MNDALARAARATLAAILLLGIGWTAPAGTNEAVAAANALYHAGKYQEALDAYTRLAKELPESAELLFNQGAAWYRLGDMEKAREAFQSAASLAESEGLKASSAYNLGNVAMAEGQQLAAEKPEDAIAALGRSLGYYRDALSRDSALSQAAHNQELAKRTIRELRQRLAQEREQERQQQEQARQQEQQEQQEREAMKEKIDQLIQRQQEQAQQSETAADQQRRQQAYPTQSGPTPEQMEQMAGEQGDTREQTEEVAREMEGQQRDAEARSRMEQAAEKQRQAEEDLRSQDPGQAKAAQEEALEELKQARSALENEPRDEERQARQEPGESETQPDEGEASPPAPQSQGQPEGESAQQDEAESAKIEELPAPDAEAREILNRERQNMEERAARGMRRARPVEKDW